MKKTRENQWTSSWCPIARSESRIFLVIEPIRGMSERVTRSTVMTPLNSTVSSVMFFLCKQQSKHVHPSRSHHYSAWCKFSLWVGFQMLPSSHRPFTTCRFLMPKQTPKQTHSNSESWSRPISPSNLWTTTLPSGNQTWLAGKSTISTLKAPCCVGNSQSYLISIYTHWQSQL